MMPAQVASVATTSAPMARHPTWRGFPMMGPISLHGGDGIDDRQMGPNRGVQIEDGLSNTRTCSRFFGQP